MPRPFEQEEKKHGCVFWGCLTVGIGVVVAVVVGIVMVRNVANKLKRMVADEPAEIRVFEPTAEQAEETKAKLTDFVSAALSGETTSFAFSADDLNATVAMPDSPLAPLKGKAYISMEGNELKAEASMPLAELGFPDKYLNGVLGLSVRQEDDRVKLYITDVRVNDEPLPALVMKKIGNTDLLKNTDNMTVQADSGPKQVNLQKQIRKFVDKIHISDGQFHLALAKHQPFISDQPADIELYTPTAQETAAARAKVTAMQQAAEKGSDEEFTLTESELNTLVALALKEKDDAQGKARISLRERSLTADGSFSLDKTGLKGKYFNGRVTMRPREADGRSRLFIHEIEVEGELLPEFIMKEVRKQDVLKRDGKDDSSDETEKLIAKAHSVDVHDAKLVVRFGSKSE